MLLLTLYTGQPNRTHRDGGNPWESLFVSTAVQILVRWHLAFPVLCSKLAAYLSSQFRCPPTASLESHPARPQELSPSGQKLTVVVVLLGSVR